MVDAISTCRTESDSSVSGIPYTQDAGRDRVRILKGRRLLSPKLSDTLAVKLLGGPTASIYLDVVKNPDLLLSPEMLPLYDFHLEEPAAIDERPQYVISFRPNRQLPMPFTMGGSTSTENAFLSPVPSSTWMWTTAIRRHRPSSTANPSVCVSNRWK